MKNIKLYSEYINEELNILKGPSDEEINQMLDKLSPNEALLKSAENDYFIGVKNAIDRGADVNIKDIYERSALMFASKNGHLDLVKYLVKHGAL